MYDKYIKRILDFGVSFCAVLVLLPLFLLLGIIGWIAMKGNPFFTQLRPGKDEKIFKLIKFRTMTCETDENGDLLPDEQRLTQYGDFLRSTSLDELPELFNILKGDMSLVGPRPQLVRDMVFMTAEQRRRHTVRPGLTGLAQVSGRNCIRWEDKFLFDLQYIDEEISFFGDIKILVNTVVKVLKKSDIAREGTVSDIDFGDYLLQKNEITLEEYEENQELAKELMKV